MLFLNSPFTGERRKWSHDPSERFFGVTPLVCSIVWAKCVPNLPLGAEGKHLLWAFMFLKVYCTEEVHCRMVGTNPTTFRKWNWIFVEIISDLQVVSLFYFNIYIFLKHFKFQSTDKNYFRLSGKKDCWETLFQGFMFQSMVLIAVSTNQPHLTGVGSATSSTRRAYDTR